MPFVKQIPKSQHKINNIGGFFRNYRINDGLSLAYVADSIRMNKGFLSDLENGKRNFQNGLYRCAAIFIFRYVCWY